MRWFLRAIDTAGRWQALGGLGLTGLIGILAVAAIDAVLNLGDPWGYFVFVCVTLVLYAGFLGLLERWRRTSPENARRALRVLLGRRHQEGIVLLHRNPQEWADIEVWLQRCDTLIRAAYGEGEMLRLVGEPLRLEPFRLARGVMPTEPAQVVAKRLRQLELLMERSDSIRLESGFDSGEWE